MGSRAQAQLVVAQGFSSNLFLKKFVLAELVFVAACGLSLVATSRGYCLVAVHGLLTAVSSLVAELRF